ncbi:hypothetical protein LMG9673_04029 [Ralstonia pseudosolanacearum]|nr:hypothetical protein LMG9673_04029 [Ralstonia pseudosolanacearum]
MQLVWGAASYQPRDHGRPSAGACSSHVHPRFLRWPPRQGVCCEPCSGCTHPPYPFLRNLGGRGVPPGGVTARVPDGDPKHLSVCDVGFPVPLAAMRRYGGVIAGWMPTHAALSSCLHSFRGCRWRRPAGSPMCMSPDGSTRNGRSSTTVLVVRSVAIVESQSPTIRVVLEAVHVFLAVLADERADIRLGHARNAGLPPVQRDSERHRFQPADRLPGAARGAGSVSKRGSPREVQAATASAGVPGWYRGGGRR